MKTLTYLKKHLVLQDLLLFAGLLTIGAFFFLFFYRKAEFIPIRVKVTDQDVLYTGTLPKPWYANRFEIGDTEIDAVGRTITEILAVESIPITPENTAVYLDLNAKAIYNTRTKRYSIKGRELIFGAPVRFNLSKVTFDGIIVEFPGSQENRAITYGEKTVKALARSAEPFLAESIQVGDIVFDKKHQPLVEITDVEVRPAAKVVTTDLGNVLLRTDPLYKDIYLTAKVRVKTVNDQVFLFEDLPFAINQTLPINLPNTYLFPVITEISD